MSLIPEGVKIYFGATLDKKIAIEEKITTLFEKNCYKLIELPMYEYYSDLEDSFSENILNLYLTPIFNGQLKSPN